MQAPTHGALVPDLCDGRAVLVVVVVAQLMAIVLTLTASYYEPFSFERLGLTSFFMQWVGLTSAAVLCGVRRWLNRLPSAWAAMAVVALVVLITLVCSTAAALLPVWVNPVQAPGLWDTDIAVNVGIAAIVASVVMRYFYVQEQLRLKGQAALEARIQALQSRIRPHFLFNSMNIISSLIAVNPDAAEQAVEDLSRLFRASLREGPALVPLSEELDLCRRYTRIEELRIGDRLRVHWQLPPDPGRYTIPLLTLQPLLENAIYHGIQPRAEGGDVQVRIGEDGDMLEVAVINPLPEVPASGGKGNHMALDNIRHRLVALYGDRARVEAAANNNEYRVTLRYPLA
ncbi:sensor histidine kinase [Isoalcanivorax indicus]|uniref:sensor histidine kinase n=1 Tax=Isoalcanivorax indicus TaxID=2202653 RepID=UPI000DB90EDD|nr:sensor histidine kinase [Isoalcanivorax indicus]